MKKLLLALIVLTTHVAQAQDQQLKSAFGPEGVNGEIRAVAVQADGKIVIGGRFSEVAGVPRNNVARLNADGTLDRTFAEKISQGVNGVVNAIAIQPQGGVIVGGVFNQADEYETMNLARYNLDGSIDKAFGSGSGMPGANGTVLALAVQPDGKIVVGGNFSTVFGQPRRSIARLNTDNTLDAPLVPQNSLDGTINATSIQPDNTVIAGGAFTLLNKSTSNILQVAPPAGE